ncbi:hypothetical protein [Kitasatospora sp. NE20-6]
MTTDPGTAEAAAAGTGATGTATAIATRPPRSRAVCRRRGRPQVVR